MSFDVYKQTQQDTRLAKQDSTVKSIVKKLKRDCGYESRKMGTNINPCLMVGLMTKSIRLIFGDPNWQINKIITILQKAVEELQEDSNLKALEFYTKLFTSRFTCIFFTATDQL